MFLCGKKDMGDWELFGSMVTMEIKDQDVSHSGMVTSVCVCEQPCFAIPDTITQQRDRGVVEREDTRGESGRN